VARVENKRPSISRDGPAVKVLFVLSCVLICGVVLYLGGVAAIDVIFSYAGHEGTVRRSAYAATDEQSWLTLENAEMKEKNLSALMAGSEHRIIIIGPKTPVRYEGQLFYDGEKLSTKSNGPNARPVLRVKVLAGPEKGRVVWIAACDVGFYNFP